MKKTIPALICIIGILLSIVFIMLKFVLFEKRYQSIVEKYCYEYNLSENLVYAIIKAESGFDEKAISSSEARGLMQIMDSTAKWIAKELNEEYNKENLFIPEVNIRYGCFYLRYLFEKFKNKDIVICAYNAGEGVVVDWIDDSGNIKNEDITYLETKNYLKKVKIFEQFYSFL